MASKKEVTVVINGEEHVSVAAQKAEGALGGFASRAGSILKGLAAAAAAVALGDFFKNAVEEAQKSNVVMGQLALTVKNSGRNWEEFAPHVESVIAKLVRFSVFSDDDLAAALQQMILKTGDAGWSLNNLGQAADLAAAANVPLEAAAAALAKAHAGNTKQLFQLIPELKGASNWSELLAEKTNGAAAAQEKALGPIAQVKKQWAEVTEAVGKAILNNAEFAKTGNTLADSLASLARWIETNGNALTGLLSATLSLVSAFSGVFVPLLQLVGTTILGLGASVKLVIFTIQNLAYTTENSVGKMLMAFGGLAEKGSKFLAAFGITIGEGVGESLRTAGESMVQRTQLIFNRLQQEHDEYFEGVRNTYKAIWSTAVKQTQDGGEQLQEETSKNNKKLSDEEKKRIKDAEKLRADALKKASEDLEKWGEETRKGIVTTTKNMSEVLSASLTVSIDGAREAIKRIKDATVTYSVANAGVIGSVEKMNERTQGYLTTLGLLNDAHVVTQAIDHGLPPKDGVQRLQAIIDKLSEQAGLEFDMTGNADDFAKRMDLIAGLKEKIRDLTRGAAKDESDANKESEKALALRQKMMDNVASIARTAIDAAQAFGIMDRNAASTLNSVVNVAESLGKIAGGSVFAGVSGLLGGVANIVSTMMAADAERRALLRDNSNQLEKLRTEGVTLSNKASGGQISGVRSVLDSLNIQQLIDRQKLSVNPTSTIVEALSRAGLRLSDLDTVASEIGINIRNKDGGIIAEALKQLLEGLKSTNLGAMGQSFPEQLQFLRDSQRLEGTRGTSQIGGMLDFLREVGGVSALNGLDASDPAALRQALLTLFVRLNNGGVGDAALGKLTGQGFKSVLEELIGLVDGLGPADASGAESIGSSATVVDVPGIGSISTGGVAQSVQAAIAAQSNAMLPVLAQQAQYQSQIAENTARTVEWLEQIHTVLSSGDTGIRGIDTELETRRRMNALDLGRMPVLR